MTLKQKHAEVLKTIEVLRQQIAKDSAVLFCYSDENKKLAETITSQELRIKKLELIRLDHEDTIKQLDSERENFKAQNVLLWDLIAVLRK